MSLTEREKEIALKCAMKGDLCVDEGCLVVSRGDVLDMFDDFLSRIREEQEAVGIVRMTKTHDPRPVPKWIGTSLHIVMDLKDGDKLFTTPPATLPSSNSTESDCKELVEALEEMLDDDEIASVLGKGAYSRLFGVLTKHKASMGEKE